MPRRTLGVYDGEHGAIIQAMLVLRPTKMLAKRIKLPLGPDPVASPNPYADWCIHGFNLGPSRWLIFTHTGSLLSAMAPGRGITTPAALVQCFAATIQPHLMRCGYERHWQQHIAPHLDDVHWAPIPNRSILGSMNELIYLGSWDLDEYSLEETNLRLADVPMMAQTPSWPRDKFVALDPR